MNFSHLDIKGGRFIYVLNDIERHAVIKDKQSYNYLPIHDLNKNYIILDGDYSVAQNLLFGLPMPQFTPRKKHVMISYFWLIEKYITEIHNILKPINKNLKYWYSNISSRMSEPFEYPKEQIDKISKLNNKIDDEISGLIGDQIFGLGYERYANYIDEQYNPNVKQHFLF